MTKHTKFPKSILLPQTDATKERQPQTSPQQLQHSTKTATSGSSPQPLVHLKANTESTHSHATLSSRSLTYREPRSPPYCIHRSRQRPQAIRKSPRSSATRRRAHKKDRVVLKGLDRRAFGYLTKNRRTRDTSHRPSPPLTTQEKKGKFDLRTLIQTYFQA